MTGRLIGFSRLLIRLYERRRLSDRSFVLVSNNCWGFELYRDLRRPYDTPFVGLYIHPECYLSLLRRRLPHDLRLHACDFNSEREGGKTRHPVGRLAGGEEIHFLHYNDPEEARARWTRRVERLQTALDKHQTVLAVKFCDRDGATADHFRAFHRLGFAHRLSLSADIALPPDFAFHLYRPELRDPAAGKILDGVNLYWARYRHFDITSWIRAASLRHTPCARLFKRLP